MADIALRLSLLSSIASNPEDRFDANPQLDHAAIIHEARENTTLLDTAVPADAIHAQLFAARMQTQPLLGRLRSFGAYLAAWRDAPEETCAASDWGPADSIFVQAFGRDTYTDDELPEIADIRQSHATDTEALDELLAKSFVPGPSNEALALNTRRYIEEASVEAMAQWEVAAALRQADRDWYERYSAAIHVLWPQGQFYPTTEVKRDSIALLRERHLYAPFELAHPGMLVRAQAIIRRQGVVADAPPHEPTIPFDPESTQPWVRSKAPWVFRETLTRAHHLLLGKVRF